MKKVALRRNLREAKNISNIKNQAITIRVTTSLEKSTDKIIMEDVNMTITKISKTCVS